jgi:glycosyltransferase involved in cell wall biosynthesis
MHNVPRYLWGLRTALQKTLHPIYRNVIMPPLKHIWRIWDRQTSQRPDVLLANSHTVQKRIQKFYRRKSTVLYPPVKVKSFLAASREINNKKDFFIYFGRLEKYKNVDMAIRACVKHKQKLKIIGVGSAKKNLEQLVQELEGEKYVEFLGWVEFQKLKEIVAQAKAFIFPCFDEDFGIVPVESMAAGTPVIGFNGGGITETVINGKTGILLEDFSQQSLDEAVANFDEQSFLKKRCQSRAKEFSTSQFNQNLMDIVGSHL